MAASACFDSGRRGRDAYRILDGTKWNCAGGATPWDTWLSCEEHGKGLVWECDPTQGRPGHRPPGHGQLCARGRGRGSCDRLRVHDRGRTDSRLYRFRPLHAEDLSDGVLEAASVDANGHVVGHGRAQAGTAARTPRCSCGGGAWFANGHMYFCTTANNRVWALVRRGAGTREPIYDASNSAPMRRCANRTM